MTTAHVRPVPAPGSQLTQLAEITLPREVDALATLLDRLPQLADAVDLPAALRQGSPSKIYFC